MEAKSRQRLGDSLTMIDNDRELLAWACAKLAKAQTDKIYGTVTFRLEAGKLTHSEVKETDRPGLTPPQGVARL